MKRKPKRKAREWWCLLCRYNTDGHIYLSKKDAQEEFEFVDGLKGCGPHKLIKVREVLPKKKRK